MSEVRKVFSDLVRLHHEGTDDARRRAFELACSERELLRKPLSDIKRELFAGGSGRKVDWQAVPLALVLAAVTAWEDNGRPAVVSLLFYLDQRHGVEGKTRPLASALGALRDGFANQLGSTCELPTRDGECRCEVSSSLRDWLVERGKQSPTFQRLREPSTTAPPAGDRLFNRILPPLIWHRYGLGFVADHPRLQSVLDRAQERLMRGRPEDVLIVGPPGVGKSMVLAELVRRLDGKGRWPLETLPAAPDAVEDPRVIWVGDDLGDRHRRFLIHRPRHTGALLCTMREDRYRNLGLGERSEAVIKLESYRAAADRDFLKQIVRQLARALSVEIYPDALDHLVERCDGIPGYLETVIHAAVGEGSLTPDRVRRLGSSVWPVVRSVIEDGLDHLGADGRDLGVATLAAVARAGGLIPMGLLPHVVGVICRHCGRDGDRLLRGQVEGAIHAILRTVSPDGVACALALPTAFWTEVLTEQPRPADEPFWIHQRLNGLNLPYDKILGDAFAAVPRGPVNDGDGGVERSVLLWLESVSLRATPSLPQIPDPLTPTCARLLREACAEVVDGALQDADAARVQPAWTAIPEIERRSTEPLPHSSFIESMAPEVRSLMAGDVLAGRVPDASREKVRAYFKEVRRHPLRRLEGEYTLPVRTLGGVRCSIAEPDWSTVLGTDAPEAFALAAIRVLAHRVHRQRTPLTPREIAAEARELCSQVGLTGPLADAVVEVAESWVGAPDSHDA